MLLPEPHRSSLPFVVSLTIQCSLVVLLAIPWTVQRLTHTSLELPIMLNVQPPKPMEAPKTTHAPNTTANSQYNPNRQIRVFRPPFASSNDPNTDPLPTGPEIAFDPGMPMAFGAPAHLPDVLARSGAGPTAPPNSQAKTEAREHPIVVGGKVQAAKLIRQVQPAYPAPAREFRVQGVVNLEAIIGTDGTVQQLRVLNGHPLLVPSAVQAVQQWLYSPTVLNGKAVEVNTTIEVRFTLSQSR